MAAEVSGRDIWVSLKFEVGERFEEDYEACGEIMAASELATAVLNLEQERTFEQAKRDWDALGGGGKASELVLRKPQRKCYQTRRCCSSGIG